ncbi:hypothetical protein BO70DRAFT_343322 [Aspergillus heteromorphus CBS 117.55]|uniref:Polyketide synthase n=1 Tax=Aspergillus heteromorphus CBS 117.55 TaxID=1448321 RepID=A0A317V9Y0_9EURO|nr:uncharacterized protein BO70DRAFT_343322 [Aspergillus heteromorphus CBS 117.55]PWY71026.1 hypothetical protein BO70DRAFT_343322 [Aspergillus heteromorphus CBS 117.55]
MHPSSPSEPIAIIGSSCRYPGPAKNPSHLWQLLCDPYDLSKKAPADRFNIDGFYHSIGEHHGTTNAPKAYWLDGDVRMFDAPFFSITPKEAEAIDPQSKILLEVVYEGMESAGLTLQGCAGKKVGVFAGLMTADYELMTGKDDVTASQYTVTGTSRSLVSNRLSYFFNWNGPSMTIDTACSSSLVAMHQAVLSLRSGECSLACVAGANIMLGPDTFIIESSLHMLSPDGQSRMWDASANGYARGEGAGCFFIKTLSQALADGDGIECIIRETGVNSDGRTKGITMPSPDAQAALIRDTYYRSGLDPQNPLHRCQYFEAHGTGTQAGDPREAEAIHRAFFGMPGDSSNEVEGSLLVGSIKTIIGHTEGAAGVAGVLKASMALQQGVIPPNQHFHNVNPSVAPFMQRLCIPTALTPWPTTEPGQPLRASVNSFGFGGTNSHAILEKYDPAIHGRATTALAVPSTSASLPFVFSANSDQALVQMVDRYREYLATHPAIQLNDLAHTLAFRRSPLAQKLSFPPTNSIDALIQSMEGKLTAARESSSDIGVRTKPGESATRILGIFTGQGAQWPTMGKALLETSPSFRSSMQALDEVLQGCPTPPRWSLITELLAPPGQSRLQEASLSQPLCTAIQIALVDLLRQSGVHLDAVVGHSSGEIGAAYAAGSLTARDAILIAYYRGVHAKLARSPNGDSGAMMAVGMGVDEALDFCSHVDLAGRVFIAASNGGASVTLSGDEIAIHRAKALLDEEKRFCRLLKVDTAYHSHHMDPCADPYLQSLKACGINAQLSKPECPWVSSVYGPAGSPTALELSGRYWRDNMVQPVLFYEALTRVLAQNGPFDLVLEIGPHPALKGPAMQTIQESIGRKLPYSGVLNRGGDDSTAFADALGMIWTYLGPAAVDLAAYARSTAGGASYKLVRDRALPSYPWEHDRPHLRQPRTMRQYLNRPTLPHELLGIRTPDDTPSEYRWRNILTPAMLPWLQHHRFQSQIIVPATAYCVMALDAARAMATGYGKNVGMVEIQDLLIRNGITMEDDTQGIEILASLQYDAVLSTEHTLVTTFTLNWTPLSGNLPTKLAVSGRVVVDTSVASPNALPQRVQNAASTTPIDLDAFYESMSDIGLAYTEPFRALVGLNRRMNFASAQLQKPHPLDPSELSVRPALLDACCQTIFAAIAAPADGTLWTSFLPQSIARLRFNPALCEVDPTTSHLLDVEATVTRFERTSTKGPASFRGDVEIYNATGQMEIQIQGLTVQSFATASSADDRELYLQTIYKRDPWTGFDPSEEVSAFLKSLTHVVDRITHRHAHINVLEIDLGGAEPLTSSILEGLGRQYASYTYAGPQGMLRSQPQTVSHVEIQKDEPGLGLQQQEESFDLVVISRMGGMGAGVEAQAAAVRGLMHAGGFLIAVHSDGAMMQERLLRLLRSGNTADQQAPTPSGVSFEECGFSAPVHHHRSLRTGMSLSVAQATSPEILMLQSPIQHAPLLGITGKVLIIGGRKPETRGMVQRMQEVLSQSQCQVLVADSLEDLRAQDVAGVQSTVLLADLDEPILRDISASSLPTLQAIFSPNRYVLWLTQQSMTENPWHAASMGLGRTVKSETPQLELQFLDLDTLTGVEDLVTASFLRLAYASEKGTKGLTWTDESELRLVDGNLLIPRVVPIPRLNDRLNSARRTITRDVDGGDAKAPVELLVTEERGEEVYSVQSQTEVVSDGQTVRVKTLYNSLAALKVDGDGSALMAGLGVREDGKHVLFLAPQNSSWVTVPQAWTQEIDDNVKDDASAAAFLLRITLASRILATGNPILPLAVLEADSLFASAMDFLLEKDGQRSCHYVTSSQELALKDDRFLFVHPHSSQRVLRAALPATLGSIFDLSVGSPLAGALSSYGHIVPASSLAGVSSSVTAESVDTVALQLTQDWLRTKPSQVGTTAIRPVAELVGQDHPQPILTLVDWTRPDKLPSRIRPIDPASVLSPERTYVFVGLAGDLGESLCRLMALHGARHFVIASRNPVKAEGWAQDLRTRGVQVHLASLDVTSLDAVRQLERTLKDPATGHPPVGGVVNGAMLLSDGLFADMTLESLQRVMDPKTVGSQNLSDVFCDPGLDFFIMLSSLTSFPSGTISLTNTKQYMAGVAGQRRNRGLAGSVLDIGILYGIGYVNRVDGAEIYQNLRRQGYLPISERDVHEIFVEAILTGHAGSAFPSQISTGLQRWSPNAEVPLPWYQDPKFAHHRLLADGGASAGSGAGSGGGAQTVQALLLESKTAESIAETLQTALAGFLESMLRLPAGSVKSDMPITDLGVDSLAAVDIRSWFLKEVKQDMPVLKILGGSSLATLCQEVSVEIEESRKTATTDDDEDATTEEDTSSAASDLFNSLHLAPSTDLSSEPDDADPERLEQIAPMSFGQARMWFPFLLLDDKTTYNCTTSYRLRGPLDVDRYERAIQSVVRKHAIFRTCFYTESDEHSSSEAMQAVSATSRFKLNIVHDPDDTAAVDHETALIAGHSYALGAGDVFIATLIQHSATYHTVIFGYHHIIVDGVSWQHFLQEVERFYTSTATSASPAADYLDFAIKQQADLTSPSQTKKRTFWKDQFTPSAPSPIPLLPFARVPDRKPLQQYSVREHFIEFDRSLVSRIKSVATANHSTTFHVYLAALQVMLYRLLNVTDVCIGITDANRSDPAHLDTIGLMLDSLPLWFRHSHGGETFAERLQQTRSLVYSALGNSGIPLDVILADSGIESSTTHLPLFQVLVNYRMGAFKQKSVGEDVALDFLAYEDARHPFDFIMNIDEEDGRAGLTLSVQTALYDVVAGEGFLGVFTHFLEVLTQDPGVPFGVHRAFPREMVQKGTGLGVGSGWAGEWPATLPERVEAQASRFAADVAVQESSVECSYAEVMDRVQGIMAVLMQRHGMVKGSRVGVLAGPSLGSVLSLLALLRAGAVYVPLDERNSDERLAGIVQDASVGIVICDAQAGQRARALLSGVDGGEVMDISPWTGTTAPPRTASRNEAAYPASHDLAMIMFTSGSTGRPKGIMLSHGNFLAHVHAATTGMGLGRETVLQQSALGYDASLAQIFYALANGGKLVMSSNRSEMGEIAAVMQRERVSLTLMAPSEYAVLFQYGGEALAKCDAWRVAMCGGEAFTPQLRLWFRQLKPTGGLKVMNAYGPTEISVACNIGEVDYLDETLDAETRIPMGRALPGYSVMLVDDSTNSPVPLGCPGQIAVHGRAVSSLGYLNNEALTREKFVLLSQEGASTRWYLTGDMGRMDADGHVAYLRRIGQDSQIKLRGMRIELSEVSNAILDHAGGGISHAVVGVRGADLEQFLVAYVVLSSANTVGNRNPEEYLQDVLRTLPLPLAMRPAQAIPLRALPTNASGKLDMPALDALPLRIPSSQPIDGRSLTATEQQLKSIWESVLGQRPGLAISKHSNFFSSGGNSLLLLKLQAEIRKQLGAEMPLPELFRINTLESLALTIQDSSSSSSSSSPLPPSQVNPFSSIDWESETLPPAASHLHPSHLSQLPLPTRNLSVILTGATGFLGRAIARALQSRPEIQQIHCIAVRNRTSAAARALEASCPKAVLHSGSLTQPRLGLGDDEARLLFADAAAVIHNGADVSFLKPYATLRDANVGSTHELLRLCGEVDAHPVPIHFVSTAGVAALLPQPQAGDAGVVLHAESLSAHRPGSATAAAVDGYVASKWAAEVMLERAAGTGSQSVTVYRPSSITGPDAPMLDILHTVLRLSMEMRTVPSMKAWEGAFDLIGVEEAAEGVVGGVLGKATSKSKTAFVHLSGQRVVPVDDVKRTLEKDVGCAFEEVGMAEWLRRARGVGLNELVAAYLGEMLGEQGGWKLPRVERTV